MGKLTLFVVVLGLLVSLSTPYAFADVGFSMFVDPHPDSDLSHFGSIVLPLANGNVVITAPGDDAGASNAGAVYLYDGKTGGPISTLTGSNVNDGVGSGGVVELPNGNFVVLSPNWGDAHSRQLSA